MAENRNQQSPKPESASKPAKRAYEEHERERASNMDQDNARGERNAGNFQNDRERASEAGRKGGQR